MHAVSELLLAMASAPQSCLTQFKLPTVHAPVEPQMYVAFVPSARMKPALHWASQTPPKVRPVHPGEFGMLRELHVTAVHVSALPPGDHATALPEVPQV